MQPCDRQVVAAPTVGAPALSLGPDALVEALKVDPPLVTTEWRIQHRGSWITLSEHPERPWLNELQRLAVAALREADPDRAEFLCRRTLEFARSDDHHAAVRDAQFLLAYLEAAGRQWTAAAERLGGLTRGPDRFLACAQNNLAYVQCWLRQPALAGRLWLTAVQGWPQLVPAWISLKNLAEIMLAEGARRCAELPPWDELRRQAHKALLNLSAADFQRWLSPDAPFPACESLLILPVERHSPALSSHLPGDDSGLPAARRLLAQASAALAAGKDELADALAARAAAESSKLAANAQEIRVQAACMRAERERLADAQRFHRLLERFDRELEQLTLDRVDKPRATLALMQALTADTQRLHECQCRFQRRVTRLCHDAAEQSEGKDREKWLRLAAEASDCLNLQRAVALPRD